MQVWRCASEAITVRVTTLPHRRAAGDVDDKALLKMYAKDPGRAFLWVIQEAKGRSRRRVSRMWSCRPEPTRLMSERNGTLRGRSYTCIRMFGVARDVTTKSGVPNPSLRPMRSNDSLDG